VNEDPGGIVAGYLGGVTLAFLVFSQLGLLALLLTPFALLLHAAAARRVPPVAASHHRFLARSWGYAAVALVGVYALIAVPLWQLISLAGIALDAIAAADPGRELETAWASVSAYLQHREGYSLLWMGLALALHTSGAFLIAAWLAVRLIRRWLRWVDRHPA
jgi:hypothetical protein